MAFVDLIFFKKIQIDYLVLVNRFLVTRRIASPIKDPAFHNKMNSERKKVLK